MSDGQPTSKEQFSADWHAGFDRGVAMHQERASAWDAVADKMREINPSVFASHRTGLQCVLDQIERMREEIAKYKAWAASYDAPTYINGAAPEPPVGPWEVFYTPMTAERGVLNEEVKLVVHGPFHGSDEKRAYCEALAAQLNRTTPPPGVRCARCEDSEPAFGAQLRDAQALATKAYWHPFLAADIERMAGEYLMKYHRPSETKGGEHG